MPHSCEDVYTPEERNVREENKQQEPLIVWWAAHGPLPPSVSSSLAAR